MSERKGTDNVKSFERLVAEHDKLGDWAVLIGKNKKNLDRKKLANACGFSLSVLSQNLSIRTRLLQVEASLRKRSILMDIEDSAIPDDVLDDKASVLAQIEDRIESLEKLRLEIMEALHGISEKAKEDEPVMTMLLERKKP